MASSGAFGFESRAGDGWECDGGCAVDVIAVFVEEIGDKLVGVVDVAAENGSPFAVNDLVEFRGIACEGASGLSVGSFNVTFDSGDGFSRVWLQGLPDESRPGALVMHPSPPNLVFVLDFAA